jgi:hypothetical protein
MNAILLTAAVLATPNFPGVIQQQLGLAQPPRCTICHATDAGGIGTVVKPFGVYLRSRGLRAGDETSLRNALLAAAGEQHSSGGGKTDIEALEAGQDPNGAEAADLVPAYGCSTGGCDPALGALLVVLAFSRARRRAGIVRSDRLVTAPSDARGGAINPRGQP